MNQAVPPEPRSKRLLTLVAKGMSLHADKISAAQLGDRAAYIGMSDVGQYLDCPRSAVLRRLSLIKVKEDVSHLLTLQRGHWFEDGIVQSLLALHMPLARQLEIALDVEGCPVRAHLDFVLASATPRPTVRVLEVKSMARLPDHLYAAHEAQVYGQIGLLARCWNRPTFNLKDETGIPRFSGLTFSQAANELWGITLPDNPAQVDMEVWVLALSMTDARAFGPYLPNGMMLNACLNGAKELWRWQELGLQGTLDLDSLPLVEGFHPLCSCCDASSACPKFAGQAHPELEDSVEELALWKAQRSSLNAKIKEREASMKEWYAHAGIEGQWIVAGSRRFRVSKQSGRRTLDRGKLMGELSPLMGIVNAESMLTRCESEGAPFDKLTVGNLDESKKDA